ncbi:hypothetical protein COO60DRAFT_535182 [Scenedesmus sp. NREL 46B-D3]|nr:hypothetical protein COO60DRAFT_535182 [Scenedesmus sp. NREL 46B-D3]
MYGSSTCSSQHCSQSRLTRIVCADIPILACHSTTACYTCFGMILLAAGACLCSMLAAAACSSGCGNGKYWLLSDVRTCSSEPASNKCTGLARAAVSIAPEQADTHGVCRHPYPGMSLNYSMLHLFWGDPASRWGMFMQHACLWQVRTPDT